MATNTNTHKQNNTGGPPIKAQRLTTRYGRVSYTLAALDTRSDNCPATNASSTSTLVVHCNISLPAGFADPASQPSGGVRLRVRPPVVYAGKMCGVQVGGQAWPDFDSKLETVDFPAASLTLPNLRGMHTIVVSFA
jgi:hypothetical protein